MNKNLHDIDKLFKSALEQHEDIPSPGVWDAIDNKLDKNKVVDINKKYNQLKKIAILLFLLLSGVVFYEYNSHKSNKDIARKNPVQNPAASEAYQTSVSGRDSITNLESKNSNSISGEYHGLKESAYSGSALNKNNDKKKLESEIVKDNGIGNKLIRRKGKLNVNFTNAQSSVTDQDNLTNGMQAGISASKYYSPIELMPDVTRNFDEQLNKRVSNFTATNLIFSSKVNQPIGKDNAKNSKDRKNTSRPGSARLSLTPFFSPDFAFYSLTNDHPHGRGDDRHDIKKDENHEFSFTTGVLAEYALNKHISIQSGVAYSKTTINSVPKNIYAEPDNAGNVRYRLNGSCGYAYILPHSSGPPTIGDSIKAISSKNELAYIQLPLSVKYNFSIGRFIISTTTGIAVNLLTKSTLNTVVDNNITIEVQVINNVEGLKKSYLDGLIGVGAQYYLSKTLAISIAPTARVALSSINNGAAVKTYSNSLGISAGLQIKL